MRGRLGIILFFILEATVLATAWYGPGIADLMERGHGRGYGRGRRFRDELCDELERHPIDKSDYLRREIQRIRRMSDINAVRKLSELLDYLERRYRGKPEKIVRDVMKKMGLPAPPKYRLLRRKRTAQTAALNCRALGGQLAIIRHGIDHTFAWEASQNADTNKVFIGLEGRGSGITWIDGTKAGYLPLRPWRSSDRTECGALNVINGWWIFTSCTSELSALCEFHDSSLVPPTSHMAGKPGTEKSPRPTIASSREWPRKPTPFELPGKSGKPDKTAKRTPVLTTLTSGITARREIVSRPPVKVPSNQPGGNINQQVTSNPKGSIPNVRRSFETELRFMFDYNKAINDKLFVKDLIDAIASLLKKPTSDVRILRVRPGSTIVQVRIFYGDGENANTLIATLQREAKLGGILDSVFDGRLRPIIDPVPETPESSKHSKLKIIVPIVIVVIVLVICTIIVAFFLLKKRKTVRPHVNTVSQDVLPTYKEFTANDYTKPPSEPNAPPGYDECVKHPIA